MSLLQEWAVRVAEEADANTGQTPSSSQPLLAPSVRHTGTSSAYLFGFGPILMLSCSSRVGSGANTPKSCLGLEGATFPPSYDDDTASGSRNMSATRRHNVAGPTSVHVERDGQLSHPSLRSCLLHTHPVGIQLDLGLGREHQMQTRRTPRMHPRSVCTCVHAHCFGALRTLRETRWSFPTRRRTYSKIRITSSGGVVALHLLMQT